MERTTTSTESLPTSQELLAIQALSQSNCGALVADIDARIVYVNPRLCEISGYPPSELIGQNPNILQSGNTPRETYLSLWNSISSGRSWRGSLQNKKKCGDLYWETISITPLKNTGGVITHFCAILEDVTEERLSQDARAEVEKECFEVERRESMSTMAFGIAHNLNNCLACVIAASDLARRNKGDPAALGEMLDHIDNAAKRSADFLHQVTGLLKPALPQFEDVGFSEFFRSHIQQYRESEKRPFFQTEPTAGEPTIRGNTALIHEAICALLNNAREAASDGQIELKFGSISRLQPESEEMFIPCGLTGLSSAFIEVADLANGMDSYTLRRAFNPFFSTKSGHNGLGLAKVYGIMTAHKGAIGVISSPGRGTRVRLYFRDMQSDRKTH